MKEVNIKLTYKKLYILFAFFALLVSCNEEVEQYAQMNLALCLPANEIAVHQRSPRRVMGDPGTREMFAFPKYAYIFVMKQGDGDTWSVWKREERVLDSNKWELTHYRGLLETPMDSIYRYNDNLSFQLKNDAPVGHVYAICSYRKLTFNTPFESVSSMSELLDLKFNTAPDSIQQELANIYSTPYNYEYNGEYYCSFDCSRHNSFGVDLLLYHVAAKVDIKWNVVDSVRINKTDPTQAVRLTYLEARNLYNDYAYCFRPMENSVSGAPLDAGYAIRDIVTPADEGLWWEGRSYFYTIPYTVDAGSYYPLQLKMQTNGGEGEGYRPIIYMSIDTASPFVPWLRADFKLSKPLEDKVDTKVAER